MQGKKGVVGEEVRETKNSKGSRKKGCAQPEKEEKSPLIGGTIPWEGSSSAALARSGGEKKLLDEKSALLERSEGRVGKKSALARNTDWQRNRVLTRMAIKRGCPACPWGGRDEPGGRQKMEGGGAGSRRRHPFMFTPRLHTLIGHLNSGKRQNGRNSHQAMVQWRAAASTLGSGKNKSERDFSDGGSKLRCDRGRLLGSKKQIG